MSESSSNSNQTLIRLLVPMVAVALGIFVVITTFQRSGPSAPPPAATQPAAANGTPGAAPAAGAAAPATGPALPAAGAATQPASAQTRAAFRGLRALSEPEARVATLGSLDPATGFHMLADLSAFGASVLEIRLTDYSVTALQPVKYPVQSALRFTVGNQFAYVYPMAARALYIDRQPVDLSVAAWKLETPSAYRTTRNADPSADPVGPFSEAVYSVTIVDDEERPVARIKRTYKLNTKSYALETSQEIVNLTQGPLEIIWEQNGPADLPNDDASYMGDHRSVVSGYYDLGYDPARQFIYTDKAFLPRLDVINAKQAGAPTLWPNPAMPAKAETVWFAAVNRYFAVAATPAILASPATGKVDVEPWFGPSGQWQAADVQVIGSNGAIDNRQMVTVLVSRPQTVAPGQAGTLGMNLYAGPRDRQILGASPWSLLQLQKVIVYQLGCAICTFQPLAHGLLWFLNLIHWVTRDWGVSIIILVIIVRALLHPLTRKSQINMARLGKQMQAVQPELEKIKKKYEGDQQKINTETMALYRAKGINPFNMLGCLPMFLQMPIWVALYAMLYYAIELRHQPAFYGFFQKISGGKWTFLADLSSADHFIQFAPHPITYNYFLINYIDFSAFNIIPILMAVVFFYQQKLTMPPAANEQAAQQQKMMKWMSVLWPVLLYAAPSGLTLYILASTGAGIVDSYIVRRHIKAEEARGELFKPPPPGAPKGFIGRALERIQEKMDEQQRRQDEPRNKR